MSEITELTLNVDQEKQIKQHKEVVTSQHNVDVGINFDAGSLKITPELIEKAKFIVENRIKNTAKYTQDRIDRINTNFELYYSNSPTENSNKNRFVPETFNSVHDWIDDCYSIFKSFTDMLEIKESQNDTKKTFVRKLPVEGVEDSNDIEYMRDLTEETFGAQNLTESDIYYFNKGEAIKSRLKERVDKSGFAENIKEYLWYGIISGQFIFKDNWLCDTKQELVQTKNGKIQLEFNPERKYKFTPVDARILIHPKEHKDWVIEKIQTTISDILEIILDKNDKPKKNSTYDPRMIKLVTEYTKEMGFKQLNDRKEELLSYEELTEEDETQMADSWDNEGNLTIYEAHNVPLKIEGKVFKCLVTCVNLQTDTETKEDKELNLVPIRIQKTPYIVGPHPYTFVNFMPKDNDVAGRGLPAVVESLQRIVNEMTSLATDLQEFSLWGVLLVNGDFVKESTLNKLRQMQPKEIIVMKNVARAGNLKNLYEWLTPDTSVIRSVNELLNFYMEYLKKTTRKGPTGEKIKPNPTATEIATMVEELQKSVNSIVLDLNDAFKEMIRRIYIYDIIQNSSSFNLKMQGWRLRDNEGQVEKIDVEKSVPMDVKELFVQGIGFKIKAAEEFFKKATERQQIMQAVNLLAQMGALTDPTTGQEKIYIDESGQQVKVSELKLIEKVLKLYDLEDTIEKAQPAQQAMPGMQMPTGSPSPDGAAVPNISASPNMANIANQSVSGGAQVAG